MKIISSKKVRKIFKEMWPMFERLDEIWLTDKRYYCPTLKRVEEAVKKCGVIQRIPKDEAFDCDDFALVANALVRLYFIDHEWNKDGKRWYPIAFGEAIGTKWNGWEDVHSANICICEEGVMLIEPQHGTIWKANSKNDNLFFIKV